MTTYELLQKRPDATAVLGTVQAGTLAQATRKLYRAHAVQAPQARAQGYIVQPTAAPKRIQGAFHGN